jgi:WD repeat-containing protein 48
MPTIVLGQDEVDCFAAWVSATDAGFGTGHNENGSDPKVNYGSLLLQALLEYWSQPIADMDNDIRGNEYFKVPKHTPILFRYFCKVDEIQRKLTRIFCFSEVGGRTGCRLLVRDAAGDTESALLHEAVPSWVADVVIDRNIPRFIKIPFFLLPHPMMVKQDRMKKVS